MAIPRTQNQNVCSSRERLIAREGESSRKPVAEQPARVCARTGDKIRCLCLVLADSAGESPSRTTTNATETKGNETAGAGLRYQVLAYSVARGVCSIMDSKLGLRLL
jgi:hypothetical protein